MPKPYPKDIDEECREVRITLRVTEDLHEALVQVARSSGRSMNQMGVEILHQYLAAQPADKVRNHLEEAATRHLENIDRLRARTL